MFNIFLETQPINYEKNDIIYNLDKWTPENNILYVTGLSGSGKTTLAKKFCKKYKAGLIEVDGLYRGWKSSKDMINLIARKYPDYIDFLENVKLNPAIPIPDMYRGIMKSIIDEAIRLAESTDKLIVIEGVPLFDLYDPTYFKDKPVAIKGTSIQTCMDRRLNRVKDNPDITEMLLRSKEDLLTKYKDQDNQLQRLRAYIKNNL